MGVHAWTLGSPKAYDIATKIPGNAKAPGGYCFRSKREAEAYVRAHRAEAGRYRPYPIYLPTRTYDEAITRDFMVAALARHRWHHEGPDAREWMEACGICVPRPVMPLECDLLVVEAPFR